MAFQIYTEIEINANKTKIWDILMDFESYPNWNPFIKTIEGKKKEDSKIKVFLKPDGNSGMKIKPKIIEIEKEKRFSWLGHFIIPKLFDGHHQFEIIEINDKKSKFIHMENFGGILKRPILYFVKKSTEKGFNEMNMALKQIAEC